MMIDGQEGFLSRPMIGRDNIVQSPEGTVCDLGKAFRLAYCELL
jgi:hypothetical protein